MKKYPDRLFDDISDPDSGLYKDEGNDALDKFCSTDDSEHQGDVNVRTTMIHVNTLSKITVISAFPPDLIMKYEA